jgi:hypothetical protein
MNDTLLDGHIAKSLTGGKGIDVILLDHMVEVFRRPSFGLFQRRVPGCQFAYCPVEGSITVERNAGWCRCRLGVARFAQDGLGRSHVTARAQSEIHCLPSRSTARYRYSHVPRTLTYVSSTRHDEPALRAKRCQRFSNSGTYRCTQRRIVVCAGVSPRSAIISTRSRNDNLDRKYHRTQTMMIA